MKHNSGRRRPLAGLLWLALGGCAVPSVAAAADAPAATVLVTGANRGIGFALVKIYAGRGWSVIATARKPADAVELQALAREHPGVTIETLDVTDHAQVDALAARYKGRPIDVLINNAGITGDRAHQSLGRLDYATAREVMETNMIAPVKMTEALLSNLVASRQKKLVTISSSEGSVASINAGRSYWYRASKAAVNMAMRNISFTVKADGVVVALVNPGPVATDMMKGVPIPLQPADEAAAKVVAIIAALTLERTGRFWDYQGGEVPW
jgi:NAD(P)-dependent dehydrogenase (short-subunit alcohol dehydrogenase family)